MRESGGDLDAFRALVAANPDYLAEGFSFMRARYGDIEGYMTKALGLSQQELTSLEKRIVHTLQDA